MQGYTQVTPSCQGLPLSIEAIPFFFIVAGTLCDPLLTHTECGMAEKVKKRWKARHTVFCISLLFESLDGDLCLFCGGLGCPQVLWPVLSLLQPSYPIRRASRKQWQYLNCKILQACHRQQPQKCHGWWLLVCFPFT